MAGISSQIFRIVFEDETLVVVEKLQPFLSQRSDRSEKGEGLYEFVGRAMGIMLYPVHRLDREVLGLMIFAKTQRAADSLSEQFRNREIEKKYEAKVKGRVREDEATLIHYLKKNEKTNRVTVFPRPTPGAKRAELSYQVLERGEGWTKLLVNLKTGRSHQIRVQLAKIGHPILGDFRYGKPTSKDEMRDDRGEIQLRSIHLGVIHPMTKKKIEWNI